MTDFDGRAYCVDAEEYLLTEGELRGLAESPGSWSRPLAREVLNLRARVAQMEYDLRRLSRYDVFLLEHYGIGECEWNEFLEWEAQQ